MKRNRFILAILLLLSIVTLAGCGGGEGGFGIYLADTGERVLSEAHIKSYDATEHTLELNEAGIARWNSFLTYTGIPKLADSLHGRVFILKVGEKEIYRGKFYSGVSSLSYDGVVILDALFKLDQEHNQLWIEFGYPGLPIDSATQDPRNSPEVIGFFQKLGRLK